jgi:hypothetical protein
MHAVRRKDRTQDEWKEEWGEKRAAPDENDPNGRSAARPRTPACTPAPPHLVTRDACLGSCAQYSFEKNQHFGRQGRGVEGVGVPVPRSHARSWAEAQARGAVYALMLLATLTCVHPSNSYHHVLVDSEPISTTAPPVGRK